MASSATYLLPKAPPQLQSPKFQARISISLLLLAASASCRRLNKNTQNWAQICLAAELAPPPAISQSWLGETSESIIQDPNLRDTCVYSFFFVCLLFQ